MAKKVLSSIFFLLGFSGFLFGQISSEKNGVTFKGFLSDYLTGSDYMIRGNFNWLDWKRNYTSGIEIGYYRYLNSSFNVGVPFRVGTVLLAEKGYNRRTFTVLDANLIYKFNNGYLLKEEVCVAPYLFAGVGTKRYWRNEQKWDLETPLGIGINFRLGENTWLQLQTQKRFSQIAKRDSWLYEAGILLTFGGLKDQDGDKVADDKDLCPTVFGLKEMQGCPDKDGDKITDNLDNCPDEAGFAALNGCPDRDRDGVTDKEDECPDEMGELNGCPDRDKDGVADRNDNCPDIAGFERLAGCPDTDLDGIADAEDKCPERKGIVAFQGCPDTDGDGVEDAIDKCPYSKGPVVMNGCPDTDEDGIADAEDKCPSQKGITAFGGCPDTDADGIADSEDECPKVKGVKEKKGCPNDDKDADGIADADDACPEVAGLSILKGCPDKDNDGVSDKEDACPTQAGTLANKGCPEIKQEDKKVLLEAMSVEFESGSAKIKPASFDILDKVVAVLNKYPEYSMNIQGHTDNQGSNSLNQTLSEQRAKACFDYLIGKGVVPTRLTYAGYGGTQPIGDNKTMEGRKQNRRVEFFPFVR